MALMGEMMMHGDAGCDNGDDVNDGNNNDDGSATQGYFKMIVTSMMMI